MVFDEWQIQIITLLQSNKPIVLGFIKSISAVPSPCDDFLKIFNVRRFHDFWYSCSDCEWKRVTRIFSPATKSAPSGPRLSNAVQMMNHSPG